MGSAIAQHFLMKGLDVVLLDIKQEMLDKGRKQIDDSLAEAIKRKIITEQEQQAILSRLQTTTVYQDLADREFIVEAVFENFEIKKKVFHEIEKVVSPECWIGSNTSSFPITELAADLAHPGRFIGVHYFFHAAKNKLIELIPGQKTSAEMVKRLEDLYFSIDKAPIVVKDAPGFVVNRFFVPWLTEATRLLEEGFGSISFIDQVAVETFKVGIGPFALMNATGVPIALHSAETLADAFGPMYSPAEILRRQVEAGIDWDLDSTESRENNGEVVRERLLAMTLGVAAQLVSEGVGDASATDLGARIGLRWPSGPFELMNEIGVKELSKMVAGAFGKFGVPVPVLFEKTDQQQVTVEHVKKHVIGSTGIIEFNRPDAMNALNVVVVNQLSECFDALEKDSRVERILFFGRGKAFVAGADIKFFVTNIANNTLDNIYNFTADGQAVLERISNSKVKTVAYINGLALGGGLEIALACQERICTERALMAFPETGIGIYPGLGGTQRTTRLIGKGLTKFMLSTGAMVTAKQALAYGLVDALVEQITGLDAIAEISYEKQKKPELNFPESSFADFDGAITSKVFEQPDLEKYKKGIGRKAPLALKKALELVDEGAELELSKALELEMGSLYEIFSTADARAGLESVIYRKKVEFTGS